ncbi:hypothetical protein [Natrialba sp. PRR66]|uniref:hypothetical protein n=1 Tax=Natrialba sp. PRR66 TaxID=3098146 RepID=UPI002B1D7072|nr:hypothetical protein [Natrialba sp. PRR66]
MRCLFCNIPPAHVTLYTEIGSRPGASEHDVLVQSDELAVENVTRRHTGDARTEVTEN